MTTFKQPELTMQLEAYQIYLIFAWNDDVQDFDTRGDQPDYEMLEAKIASALKKMLTSMHFR